MTRQLQCATTKMWEAWLVSSIAANTKPPQKSFNPLLCGQSSRPSWKGEPYDTDLRPNEHALACEEKIHISSMPTQALSRSKRSFTKQFQSARAWRPLPRAFRKESAMSMTADVLSIVASILAIWVIYRTLK